MTETVSTRMASANRNETSDRTMETGDRRLKVLVLAGGNSAERDVSLATGQAVYDTLRAAGHTAIGFDPAGGNTTIDHNRPLITDGIKAEPPEVGRDQGGTGPLLNPTQLGLAALREVDVVFIALHGGDGENGRLQALLDAAGVVYTGSGMAASSLAMDKNTSKRIFTAEAIPTPPWRFYAPGALPGPDDARTLTDRFGRPMIVKPNSQGSTVGLTVLDDVAGFDEAFDRAARFDGGVLVEQYIPGREITAAILGDRALPVVEIIPQGGLYDYEAKYTRGRSQYVCPAELTDEKAAEVKELGLHGYRALGCSGYARVDFRMTTNGALSCLEVNTLPGMTGLSLVPMAAKAAGIPFDELIEIICREAIAARAQR